MRLNKQDFADIQAHIDLTKARLAALGLTFHVDHDMHAFVDYIGSQEHTHGVPSSHDPRKCWLHPGNAFWVYVTHESSGEIIGCQAQRLVLNEDFVQDCLSQTLFANLYPSLDAYPIGVDENGDSLISGRVIYGGGLYIHPDWRGKGLLIFNRASRTIALRQFQTDYFCGMQLNTPRRRAMALPSFAF